MQRILRVFYGASIAAMTGAPLAAEQGCKIFPTGSVIEWHYDLIGAEACRTSCDQTDGCKAWSYAPHNFNPDTAPGECRLLPDSGTREDHARDSCGVRDG